MSGAFGEIAPYYDELMRTVPYRMWVGYTLLLLSVDDCHPQTMLDVCCGTGTMCEMLTREGIRMSGFDVSEGMIDRAKSKAKRKKFDIDYWVADARRFELNRRFQSAISFFDSLNNILYPAELLMAFKQVAKHLEPGAPFIFDLNTAYAFEQRMFDQQNLKSKERLRYKWVGEWDAEKRIITVTMRFWRETEEFTEVHRQRAYEPDEVEALLEEAGFTNVRTYHSYTLEKPRRNSDRVHYLAIKR